MVEFLPDNFVPILEDIFLRLVFLASLMGGISICGCMFSKVLRTWASVLEDRKREKSKNLNQPVKEQQESAKDEFVAAADSARES